MYRQIFDRRNLPGEPSSPVAPVDPASPIGPVGPKGPVVPWWSVLPVEPELKLEAPEGQSYQQGTIR